MNATRNCACLFLALALAPEVRAQQNIPHIAYAYPAGGRQGAAFEVTVGGQYLGSVSNALVSGTGVQAVVVEYNRPMPAKEFNALRDQLNKLRDKRQAARGASPGTNVWTVQDARSVAEIRDKILKNPPNRQANPAMEETVTLKISIGADAEPGERDLRLKTPNALSNPLVFCVGDLPEFSKPLSRVQNPDLDRFLERLGGKPAVGGTPKYEAHVTLPVTVNGQILPGGVDRVWFSARKGQQLLATVGARALIPYLADAVPGWFEATLAIDDARGNALAYDERYRFHPDPVIHFQVPRDGNYAVEIHDSIFRGREDFVYRLTLGELPFVTGIFPLGGPSGAKTTVALTGWNLPTQTLTLDDGDKPPGIYPVSVSRDGRRSNPVPFAVDNLPECFEQEPNDSPETAQRVTLPVIVNGRIGKPGDVDVFRFSGSAGEAIVAEVYARRLDSPLDSVLRLTDAGGRQIAFNDDYEDRGFGLETHQADSYLTAVLPSEGDYFLRLADVQHHGGPDYAYRLRISAPRPDFALRVVPSCLNLRAGLSVPVTVIALRKDGFTNAIELRLEGAPAGFSISGSHVPANQDRAQITLKAPPLAANETFNLTVEGVAVLSGRRMVHDAVPAEDMMQAFAYRHLVPARELKVAVAPNPRPFASDAIKLLSPTPVRIPAGGTARVRVATPSEAFTNRFDLELTGPPDGITIQDISPAAGGLEIVLHCDAARAQPGLQGNLIISVLPKLQPEAQPAQKRGTQRHNAAGALPAIPFEIGAQ